MGAAPRPKSARFWQSRSSQIRAFWFPPYDGAWVDVGGVRCTLVSPEILLTLAAPGVSNLFTRPAGEPAADGND